MILITDKLSIGAKLNYSRILIFKKLLFIIYLFFLYCLIQQELDFALNLSNYLYFLFKLNYSLAFANITIRNFKNFLISQTK